MMHEPSVRLQQEKQPRHGVMCREAIATVSVAAPVASQNPAAKASATVRVLLCSFLGLPLRSRTRVGFFIIAGSPILHRTGRQLAHRLPQGSGVIDRKGARIGKCATDEARQGRACADLDKGIDAVVFEISERSFP